MADTKNYCLGIVTQDIGIDCDDLIVAGVEQKGVIVNRKDVDFDNITFDADRKNVISNFPLKEGARGYEILVPLNQPFNGTTTTLGDGTVRKTFTNTVGFIVLNNDPDVCRNIIDGLANGSYVIIIENKYKNLQKATTPGDSTFQIYGLKQGLSATTLESDKYSTDTQGGWNVVMTEEGVPTSGLFLFSTSLAATRTIFDSLTVIEDAEP